MTVTGSNINFLKFKMADGRHVGKYSKCHKSPTNRPTGTQLAWSHLIMFMLQLPWQRPYGVLNILQL